MKSILKFSLARILVSTGDLGKRSEIVDLIHPNTKYHRMIGLELRSGCFGTMMKNEPIICGGCYRNITDDSGPTVYQDSLVFGQIQLLQKRAYATCVNLKNFTIWIVGGWNGSQDLNTTEFIEQDFSSNQGPELPFSIKDHGMIRFHENFVLIFGGIQNEWRSNKSWIVDPVSGSEIKPGPSLNSIRHQHSYGKFVLKGKLYVIAAGGRNENDEVLDSTEILDCTLPNSKWIMGKSR